MSLPNWRFEEYRCRSCGEMCLNDHRDSCTRHRECHRCHSVPVLDRTLIDHRVPDLLWAHQLVDDLANHEQARSGTLTGVPGEPSPGTEWRESSKPQWRLNDSVLVADGGSGER